MAVATAQGYGSGDLSDCFVHFDGYCAAVQHCTGFARLVATSLGADEQEAGLECQRIRLQIFLYCKEATPATLSLNADTRAE